MTRPITKRLTLTIRLAVLAAVVSLGTNVRAEDGGWPATAGASPSDVTQAPSSNRFT